MNDVNIICLKEEDLNSLKEIGRGTDGTVYKLNNNLLVKLYHKRVHKITNNIDNGENIKIYKKETVLKDNYYKNDLIYYTNNTEENIKLLPKDAIYKAIDRNKNIYLSSLPIGVVNLNNRFAGCLLQRKRGIQVHKLAGLPLNIKKQIYLNILNAEKELLTNYIYHIDLSNSPYSNKKPVLDNTYGHSHILVNPFNLSTQFIDLEGKSTIYTEKESEYYYRESINSLILLTLEFLLEINYEEYEDDFEEMREELQKKNIEIPMQDKIIYQNMSLDDCYELNKKLIK